MNSQHSGRSAPLNPFLRCMALLRFRIHVCIIQTTRTRAPNFIDKTRSLELSHKFAVLYHTLFPALVMPTAEFMQRQSESLQATVKRLEVDMLAGQQREEALHTAAKQLRENVAASKLEVWRLQVKKVRVSCLVISHDICNLTFEAFLTLAECVSRSK